MPACRGCIPMTERKRYSKRDVNVYVAGPVLGRSRNSESSAWSREVMQLLRAQADDIGVHLVMPEADPKLEAADPRTFYREIARRIEGATAVVSVIDDGDPATTVESTLAGVSGKPQMIVARSDSNVPRLLRGMPAIQDVSVSPKSSKADFTEFLIRARDNEWGGSLPGSAEGSPHSLPG